MKGKNMKNTRFSKLAALVLVCALALCAIVGISASADEAVTKAEIETANVAYNDMVQLAFTIKAENLPEGAVLGIMTWADGTEEFTAQNAAYSTYEASEKDGKTYYKTAGIPAPEMDTTIYVAAVYKVGNEVTIAETPFKYSALQYAGTRLTETNVSVKQAKVYENLISYGVSSDAVLLGEANYAFVKAVNGTIGSAGAEIGGWLGKTVLLRAEAKNADEEYFIKWVNEAGETVSENRLAYVTVTEAGVAEYTAIFGERADSAYAETYNFEIFTTGKLAKAPGGMNFSNLDNNYNSFYITESLNGDKQLKIDRMLSGGKSYGAHFLLPATQQITAVEYDLEFTESIANDVLNNIFIYLKDADGTTCAIRLNLQYSVADQNLNVYMESSPWTYVRDENGSIPKINAPEGSTVTLTYALDLDNIREVSVPVTVGEETVTYTSYTCDLLVYANGAYFGKIDLNACNKKDNGFFKEMAQTFDENGVPSFLLDKNCTIVDKVGIASLSAASKDISLDNFMYYDLID